MPSSPFIGIHCDTRVLELDDRLELEPIGLPAYPDEANAIRSGLRRASFPYTAHTQVPVGSLKAHSLASFEAANSWVRPARAPSRPSVAARLANECGVDGSGHPERAVVRGHAMKVHRGCRCCFVSGA